MLLPVLRPARRPRWSAASRVVQTLGDALWALFAGIALRGCAAAGRRRAAAPDDADDSPATQVGEVRAAGAGGVGTGGRVEPLGQLGEAQAAGPGGVGTGGRDEPLGQARRGRRTRGPGRGGATRRRQRDCTGQAGRPPA